MQHLSGETCSRCRRPLLKDARFCTYCGNVAAALEWDRRLPVILQNALGGDYEVVAELGRGGFAIVYSVKELPTGEFLAVKVMRPNLVAETSAAARFKREIAIASGLSHPNILPVRFASEGAGIFYYAMPRVRGETLRQRIDRSGRLDLRSSLSIFADVAQGLEYAHRRGVVHRDVKPANIMLNRAGKALVLDFGIARALAADGGHLSVTGEIIGSPAFMSPEQARGGKGIDCRSDIYSLACVLFEMLTARLPFTSETPFDLMASHIMDPPPDIRTVRPDLPARLSEAIMRAMAKHPEDRWLSVLDAADAAGCRMFTSV